MTHAPSAGQTPPRRRAQPNQRMMTSVIIQPSLLPIITSFQHGNCPDADRFELWVEPLLQSHPLTPPGRTYAQLVQSGMGTWYIDHGTPCLPRLFASQPVMRKVALFEAVVSGRLDVLRWFASTDQLHTFDLPLVSIGAWAGQLDAIRFLDSHAFQGCAARAPEWAGAMQHNDILEYFHQVPPTCAHCLGGDDK